MTHVHAREQNIKITSQLCTITRLHPGADPGISPLPSLLLPFPPLLSSLEVGSPLKPARESGESGVRGGAPAEHEFGAL